MIHQVNFVGLVEFKRLVCTVRKKAVMAVNNLDARED
jgi:hypothetical protein